MYAGNITTWTQERINHEVTQYASGSKVLGKEERNKSAESFA